MQQSPLDLIGLVMFFFAMIVGKEIADATTPYVAIIMLSAGGAFLALYGGPDSTPPKQAILFVFLRVFLAFSITVSLAEVLQHFFAQARPRYTIIFIAFFIGWVKDFNVIRTWVGGYIARIFEKKAGL